MWAADVAFGRLTRTTQLGWRLQMNPTVRAIGIAGIGLATLIGAAAVGGQRSTNQGLAVVLTVASAALWIIAGAALLPDGDRRLLSRLRLALSVYGVAFVLPAARGGDSGTLYGFQAYYVGLVVVPHVWLANVAFLAGLALARHRWRWAATFAFVVAAGLGLVLRGALPTVEVLVGYWVWLAAMGGAAVSVIVTARSPAPDLPHPEPAVPASG
jgi:hypothetical protein